MEIRKVQMTGGHTLVISLPKKWATETSIKPGDALGLVVQPNGTLIVIPKTTGEDEIRTKTISVDEDKNMEHLLRELIGAYMMGYDIIQVASKIKTTSDIRQTVRNFTQMVIGPAIVEETKDTITTKDLLNPTDMPFDKTIRRMHMMVDGMHTDAISALIEGDAALAEDVISRDVEVDRFYWLVARQYNLLLRDIKLAEKMYTTREKAINFLMIARTIERIGDHACKIAGSVEHLTAQKNIDKKTMEAISKASTGARSVMSKGINAFFDQDILAANNCIESANTVIKDCDELNVRVAGQKGEIVLYMAYIVESIRRVGLYSMDISETAINYIVDL